MKKTIVILVMLLIAVFTTSLILNAGDEKSVKKDGTQCTKECKEKRAKECKDKDNCSAECKDKENCSTECKEKCATECKDNAKCSTECKDKCSKECMDNNPQK